MQSSMGVGFKIAIRKLMINKPLYLVLINILKNLVFDVDLLMTQNRQLDWSVFVLEQQQKQNLMVMTPISQLPFCTFVVSVCI